VERKKSRKEFSDKSLKMGLFHVKQGFPAVKALPKKGKLKDKSAWIFVHMEKSVTSPINSASMKSITQIGKMSPKTTNQCFCLT
jgi:hypothetical protein